MSASRLMVAALLGLGVASPSEAQRLAPLAPVTPQQVDAAPVVATVERADAPLAVRAAARDTVPVRELSRTGAVIGGIGGGLAGAFVGTAIGAGSAHGCQGEFCGLTEAAIGFAVGESLGLAVGAHLGSRSTEHGNIVLATLTSAAILVGGTYMGTGMQRAGVVMVPLIPAMQIAATWAIDSHR